jgi:hypothetical protein
MQISNNKLRIPVETLIDSEAKRKRLIKILVRNITTEVSCFRSAEGFKPWLNLLTLIHTTPKANIGCEINKTSIRYWDNFYYGKIHQQIFYAQDILLPIPSPCFVYSPPGGKRLNYRDIFPPQVCNLWIHVLIIIVNVVIIMRTTIVHSNETSIDGKMQNFIPFFDALREDFVRLQQVTVMSDH